MPDCPTLAIMTRVLATRVLAFIGCVHGVALSSTSRILLYVDPTEERLHILPSLEARGVECILLHSSAAAAKIIALAEDAGDESVAARVRANEAPPAGMELEWAAYELPDDMEIAGVLCGSDGGLADAERLQHVLVPACSNGINAARRDKFLMLETMRSVGLGAPAQVTPSSWEETQRFLSDTSYPVVLKPRRGQASVLVGLAHDEAEALRMDTALRDPQCRVSIDSSELPAGDTNVLVQEFLHGDEWVVDSVSRDGEHKAVALWRYDKREANGAPFVYFGIEACAVAGAVEEAVLEYARSCLDALGWQWGPCHLELKIVPERGGALAGSAAPVLIEVNAGRFNGEHEQHDFPLFCRLCNGHEALEATLDAYLDAAAFDELPPTPPAELRVRGKNVKLISRASGTLAIDPAEAQAMVLEALPSMLSFTPAYSAVGDAVRPTIDLSTCAGYAHLVHADEEVLERDYTTLHALDLFQVS